MHPPRERPTCWGLYRLLPKWHRVINVPASRRRLIHLRRATSALAILEAA